MRIADPAAAGRLAGVLMLAIALGLWSGCGGGKDSTPATRLEARPTASADPVVGEPVLLDASGSVLPAGGSLVYDWSVSAPDGSRVALSDAATPRPYFVPTQAGSHAVQLVISVTAQAVTASSPPATLALNVTALTAPSADEARARLRALAAAAVPPLAPDASAPTVTPGAAGGTTQITGSRLLAWTRPEFVYGGDVRQAGSSYPDFLFGANRAVSYGASTRSGNVLSIDFVTDAATFEIFHKGLGYNSRLRILVDGRLASTAPLQLPADGALYLTQVRFAGKATRHIRLLANNPYFGGIRVGPDDTVTRPAAGTRLRAMFLGDSITESPAGQDAVTSYAPRTAELLGWTDAWSSGVGFTGYLAAPAPKLTLRQRYATDVKAHAPAVLVVAAGINDTASSDAQVQAEAAALFDLIQADLPGTLVFVAGPWATASHTRPSLAAALKAAVGSRPNFYWVPNVEDAWLTGTGNAGRPVGDGNADQYISADTTHPTPAGIEYLAGKLAAFIKAAVP